MSLTGDRLEPCSDIPKCTEVCQIDYSCIYYDIRSDGCPMYKCLPKGWKKGDPVTAEPQSFLEKNKFIIVGVVCGIVALLILGGLIYAYMRYKKKAARRLNLSMTSTNPDRSINSANLSQLSPYQSFKSKNSTSQGKVKLVHSNFIDPEFCHKPNHMSVIVEK